ncbi:MAG: glycoside hydrolase family 3 N-terminal domain-containing protein [Elusimicrobiota bacterium]|nr:glycoside hydrolase family 3 N-terminal domain-containing protein [Elusimicrobiota bacterium]
MDPARLVFPGFTVGKQDPREAEALVRLGVGGFCLYRGTPRSVAALTARLRRAARRPLLICADYEEGAWVHVPGATPLPTNLGVGASDSEAVAREKGRLTGREARALGVDWVLAPVLDLLSEPKNPIVNLRAFSADPREAARLGRAYLSGLRASGALGCLKHFPGHGSTTEDSHLDLPVVHAPLKLLNARELAPFKALARSADTVMLGHLVVPALDPSKLPFTLSAAGPKLLRRWGFRGLIATDALDMGAVAKHWDEREAALMALRGGADILLVPKDAAALVAELRVEAGRDAAFRRRCAEAERRLDKALSRVRSPRPALSVVGGAAHRRAAAPLFSACAAWTRAPFGPAPLRVAYYEPQGGKLQGGAFVAALRRALVRVRLTRAGKARKGEALVAGVFVGPRAYSGRIRLDEKSRVRLVAALKRAPGAAAISFGSPFVLSNLPPKTGGLCVYSRADAAQAAAASHLTGESDG